MQEVAQLTSCSDGHFAAHCFRLLVAHKSFQFGDESEPFRGKRGQGFEFCLLCFKCGTVCPQLAYPSILALPCKHHFSNARKELYLLWHVPSGCWQNARETAVRRCIRVICADCAIPHPPRSLTLGYLLWLLS